MQENIASYFARDCYPQLLGMQLEELSDGFAKVSLEVAPQMTNLQGIAHGGVIFSLADTAFGLAVNTRGRAVSLQADINFLRPAAVADRLTAVAREEHLTVKTAVYNVTVTNGAGETVALFRGVAYRKKS